MRTIAILAFNSWQENLRSRFFLLTIFFGGALLYLSLLLGLLSTDQEVRTLLDAGLAMTEILGLFGGIYGAATVLLREMETKTIYLILSRPVAREQYLLGRFLGLLLSVLASMLLISCFHLALLFAKGWAWDGAYLQALLGAFLKVILTASLTMFLSLFTTSVLSALSIAFIAWTLGHFIPEIRFMIAHRARHSASLPLWALSQVLPDLQLFNLRDRLAPLAAAPKEAPLAHWFAYTAVYASVWLALARQLLKSKEF